MAAKRDANEKTQTRRLRAPVGMPGETGVRRPDGRKPMGGEGAGPGSGGVTGNPIAESERERRVRACERNCAKSGFKTECEKQAGKEGFAGDAC